jgi:hypothetical protein
MGVGCELGGRRIGRCTALGFVLCVFAIAPGLAQSPASRDLTKASLEDLMNVEVTSVSKHAEFPDSNGIFHSLVERGVFGKIT